MTEKPVDDDDDDDPYWPYWFGDHPQWRMYQDKINRDERREMGITLAVLLFIVLAIFVREMSQ